MGDLCRCGAAQSVCPYKTNCKFKNQKRSQRKKRLKRKRTSPVTKALKDIAVEVDYLKREETEEST